MSMGGFSWIPVQNYRDETFKCSWNPLLVKGKGLQNFPNGTVDFCSASYTIVQRTYVETPMWNFIDKIPYTLLIIFAVFMLLAPFRPMPHVIEKLMMLKNGTLHRPIDIFDLFYHLIPLMVLLMKLYRDHAR
jgi:hypothetical protein